MLSPSLLFVKSGSSQIAARSDFLLILYVMDTRPIRSHIFGKVNMSVFCS
jgi:hypothetical protein